MNYCDISFFIIIMASIIDLELGKKIAFYCDVAIYSGHDAMSAHIANVLSTQHRVTFYYINSKYSENLSQTIDKIPLTLKNKKDGLIPLLFTSWRDILFIAKTIKKKSS